MIQINLNNRHVALAKRTANYANKVEMRNMAHSGVELTLSELRKDPTWRNNYNPYAVALDYGTANVTIQDYTNNSKLDSKHLRLISRVELNGDSVMVAYLVEMVIAQLPSIPGALALTDNNFMPNLFGSFDINGNDESGIDSVGLPGISVMDQGGKDILFDNSTENQLDQIAGNTGTPSVEIDPSMDFETLSNFIDQLAPYATYLNGNYTSNLGNQGNPGVFFVDSYAKITGNVNGYGILVVRKTGDLDLATLDLKGTFNFYGLVLFENSWSFDGTGTANIHGSVVVGSPEGASDVNVDLGGNLNINYNKSALAFAEEAAKKGIPATFKIIDIYE